jgi:hypothetical protein
VRNDTPNVLKTIWLVTKQTVGADARNVESRISLVTRRGALGSLVVPIVKKEFEV